MVLKKTVSASLPLGAPLALGLVCLALGACTALDQSGSQRNLGTFDNPVLGLPEPGPTIELMGFTEWVPAESAQPAPKLYVWTREGDRTTLSFGRAETPTILFFWDFHKLYCEEAARYLQQVQNRLAKRGRKFRIIGIVMRTPDVAKLDDWVRDNRTFFQNYLDNSQALRRMAGAEPRAIVPSFYLLDRQGRVRLRKAGFSYVTAQFDRSTLQTPEGKRQTVIIENVPAGERIEDYIERLIDEK